MTLLVLGLVLFIGVHLVPTRPALRDSLAERFGEMPYRGLFSLFAVAGLVLIALGKGSADFIAVWQPPPFTRLLPAVLMLPASVLLVAANFRTRIRCHLRHPMLTGAWLWALAHLLANGDLASMILFGSFFLWTMYAMHASNQRGATTLQGPQPLTMDLVSVAIGAVLYVLFLRFHGALFGVPLLG